MTLPSHHQQEHPLDATEGSAHRSSVDDPEDVDQRSLAAWLTSRVLDARASTHDQLGERLYRLRHPQP